VSETVRNEIISHFKIKEEFVAVTYNAIDTHVFNDVQTDNNPWETFFKEHSIGDYILAVSMFNPIKNLERLIEAFKIARLKNCKLVIVGDHYKSFKKNKKFLEYRSNPDIVFLGRIDDAKKINGLYQQAKLFAFPSLYESFGIPPLEAMASGCATLVSDAGALTEICKDAAYYINPYDIPGIALGLEKIVGDSNLQQELIKKGKERVQYFNWESSVNVIAQKLTSLSDKRRE
jgi:glycosyltransferase involved in cell wall biosynthesis